MKHLSPQKFGTSTYQLFQGFWTFINRAEASRTWSASAKKLYSGTCLVDQISLFDWRKQTGLNRIFEKRQSCLSSGGNAVSSKLFDFEKNTLYLPRHYKREQQMATTDVQCNLIAIFFTKQETFHRFDKDKSGDMNLYELRDALNHLGNNIY